MTDYYCSEIWNQDATEISTLSKAKVIRVDDLCWLGEKADPGELLHRLSNFRGRNHNSI